MGNEVIKLNLIPDGDIKAFHVSQYEMGRDLTLEIYNGEDAFNLADFTISLEERKVDGKIVTLTPDTISSNIVTFKTTKQATACAGVNIATLKLVSGDTLEIHTLYFNIIVQRSVTSGGVTSASEINDLENQIDSLVNESVSEVVPVVVNDVAPSIVDNLCEEYNRQFGGVWDRVGTITYDISEDKYYAISHMPIYGLTANSFVEIWCNKQDAYVKEITITGSGDHYYLMVEFEPDDDFLTHSYSVYAHVYNVDGAR